MSGTALDALGEPMGPAAPPPPGPPVRDVTPRQWLKVNLFSNLFNTFLTVIFGVLSLTVVYGAVRWILVTADWRIVEVNLHQFMVGRSFPADQLWRVWASLYLATATAGVALGVLTRHARVTATTAAEAEGTAASGTGGDTAAEVDGGNGARPGMAQRLLRAGVGLARLVHRFWPALLAAGAVLSFTRTPLPALLTVGLVAAFVLARGGGLLLPDSTRRFLWPLVLVGLYASFQIVGLGENGVGWDDWGGLHLTVIATIAGITLAFPIGLLLALGRRGSLPALRVTSVGYIEAFRAVPLITLLFMAINMLGFLLPSGMDLPSALTLAIVAIALFESAYIAEIVRGGLQSVPRGQIEAAQAIGLSPTGVQRLVVLPQALRNVIPAMVGQFISLFKDTSLLSLIGMVELARVAESVSSQPEFVAEGLYPVTLAFVGLLYWAGCATMSRESRRLEHRLGVGQR